MAFLQYADSSALVTRSWQRCHQTGLHPTDPANDQIITGKRIKEIIKENQALIQYTVPIFEKLFPFIHQMGHIAMLVDRQGNIIHTIGDPDFADHAQRVQLQVGANWEESRKGTNAIGTALVESRPVRIHAEQHFFRENQFLTCAAAPIYDADGEFLGVVNVSGQKEGFHPYILSLASLAADSLQNKLLLETSKHEHLLTLKELDQISASHQTPLVSLDRDRRIVRANAAAVGILGKDCLGKEFVGKKGYTTQTISDQTSKMWRSVALHKKADTPDQRGLLTSFSRLAGSCKRIVQTKELALKAALTHYPVLLLGESGTGKEVVAQSIHQASTRATQPFIAVNCSAIPDNLVESELFGYESGAFTGANREGSVGKFEAAKQGTIFLDEIGDMSLRAQAALLRVLQEKVVTPVGSTRTRPVHARVIAATHRNLPEEIKAGRFRADLYYRLKGIQINLPSLRERSDVIELAEHLLREINEDDAPVPVLTPDAQKALQSYQWPGNVRELQSVLIQAAFLAEGGEIEAHHLQLDLPDPAAYDDSQPILSLREAEIAAIQKSLAASGGNVSKAAKLLQIGRNTLYRKMEEYRISNTANMGSF